MKIPPRELTKGQTCQIWIHDTDSGENTLLFETTELLLEAPNWTLQGDALILNGAGLLWRLQIQKPKLDQIEIDGAPPFNNDHVLDPDGEHIYLSTYDDWQIYRAPLNGGNVNLITGKEGPKGLFHFLHGVSPDGQSLAFVGVEAEASETSLRFISAEIYTIKSDGTDYRQITKGGAPADGPEYSPDGEWLYFNTEVFSKNAQIARMRPDGSELTQLTFSETVDWFPHLSPDGHTAVYLAYQPGITGHPSDKWVELMVVRNGEWQHAVCAARLFGGQGTINVNSWSPDNRRFAYVTYPIE
jgi:TolB protein